MRTLEDSRAGSAALSFVASWRESNRKWLRTVGIHSPVISLAKRSANTRRSALER